MVRFRLFHSKLLWILICHEPFQFGLWTNTREVYPVLPIICDWHLGFDVSMEGDVFIFINETNPSTEIQCHITTSTDHFAAQGNHLGSLSFWVEVCWALQTQPWHTIDETLQRKFRTIYLIFCIGICWLLSRVIRKGVYLIVSIIFTDVFGALQLTACLSSSVVNFKIL